LLQADGHHEEAEREYLRSIAAWKEVGRGETMDSAAVFELP
jgi:hypothetical protein